MRIAIVQTIGESTEVKDITESGEHAQQVWSPTPPPIITPKVQCERGKVIDRGVHIYVCGRKKYLNRTLEIDSPFQTFTVGLLVEFID